MRRSDERILTTHTGSLPRPEQLSRLMVARETGDLRGADAAALPSMVRAAVADVVGKQRDTGIDVVSDGEASKIGYATYVKERLSGFDGAAGELRVADLDDYPGLGGRALAGWSPVRRPAPDPSPTRAPTFSPPTWPICAPRWPRIPTWRPSCRPPRRA